MRFHQPPLLMKCRSRIGITTCALSTGMWRTELHDHFDRVSREDQKLLPNLLDWYGEGIMFEERERRCWCNARRNCSGWLSTWNLRNRFRRCATIRCRIFPYRCKTPHWETWTWNPSHGACLSWIPGCWCSRGNFGKQGRDSGLTEPSMNSKRSCFICSKMNDNKKIEVGGFPLAVVLISECTAADSSSNQPMRDA